MICNADLDLPQQYIPPGFKIMNFDMQQGMTMLSKGSLLADKSTTLALGTIGLKSGRKAEIAKQIYDIASLLRLVNYDELVTAYDSYTKMTGFKIRCFRHDPPYTISNVCSSMVDSLHDILKFDTAVTVTSTQNERYVDFRGTYLSKLHTYTKTNHVADVLLVYLFDLSLQEYSATVTSKHNSHTGREHGVDFMHKVLLKLNTFRDKKKGVRSNLDEKQNLRTEYMQGIPDSFVKKKILRGADLEHLFLLSAVASFFPTDKQKS